MNDGFQCIRKVYNTQHCQYVYNTTSSQPSVMSLMDSLKVPTPGLIVRSVDFWSAGIKYMGLVV